MTHAQNNVTERQEQLSEPKQQLETEQRLTEALMSYLCELMPKPQPCLQCLSDVQQGA